MRPHAVILAFLLAGCGENQTHPPREHYEPPDGGPALSCVPNLDGQIDADEITPALGVPVQYLISTGTPAAPISTDVAGRVDGAGGRVWDAPWSTDLAGDRVATLEARAVDDAWYADDFPDGEVAVALDAAGTLDGIYRHDEDAFRLLGIASRQPDPPEGRTLLRYATPIDLYRFPIRAGDRHVSVGEITGGTVRGLPYAGRDTYEVAADATGELRLPDLAFEQAHRVRVHVTVEPSVGMPVSHREVSFLFECFGEVARATSFDGESDEDFARAREVRRLGL